MKTNRKQKRFYILGFQKSGTSTIHKWLEQIGKIAPPIMIAGKINEATNLESVAKIADYVDISGGLETNKQKDIKKIKNFLLKTKNL